MILHHVLAQARPIGRRDRIEHAHAIAEENDDLLPARIARETLRRSFDPLLEIGVAERDFLLELCQSLFDRGSVGGLELFPVAVREAVRELRNVYGPKGDAVL